MSRSALQAAAREKGAPDGSLADQIGWLADEHLITPDLKEWAHEARLSGNLVAHPRPEDRKVDGVEAMEIVEFAETIFFHLYVIPKRTEMRRQRLQT